MLDRENYERTNTKQITFTSYFILTFKCKNFFPAQRNATHKIGWKQLFLGWFFFFLRLFLCIFVTMTENSLVKIIIYFLLVLCHFFFACLRSERGNWINQQNIAGKVRLNLRLLSLFFEQLWKTFLERNKRRRKEKQFTIIYCLRWIQFELSIFRANPDDGVCVYADNPNQLISTKIAFITKIFSQSLNFYFSSIGYWQR